MAKQFGREALLSFDDEYFARLDIGTAQRGNEARPAGAIPHPLVGRFVRPTDCEGRLQSGGDRASGSGS
jgi:hypothetical protein